MKKLFTLMTLLISLSSFSYVDVTGTGDISTITITGSTKDECVKAVNNIKSEVSAHAKVIHVNECETSITATLTGGVDSSFFSSKKIDPRYKGKLVLIKLL